MFPVAAEERVAEGAEQRRERELDLGVGVIDGRIDEARDAAVVAEHVAGPHVAVNQRRRATGVDPFTELGGQFFQAFHQCCRQAAGVEGLAAHMEKPVVAEEIDPAGGFQVRLMQAADHRVALKAEIFRPDPVQCRQQVGGLRLGAGGNAARGFEAAH